LKRGLYEIRTGGALGVLSEKTCLYCCCTGISLIILVNTGIIGLKNEISGRSSMEN
jgi:hypothetical protein